MKLAYFVNQYPKVSHSFIRREILALEKLGFQVLRTALRGWDAPLPDPEDQREREQTRYVLRQRAWTLIFPTLRALGRAPRGFVTALRLAASMSRDSDRPLPYHLIYLAEACRIHEWLREQGIGHVHAHFGTNSAEVAMLTSALGGVSYSFTVHGPEEFMSPMGLAEKIHLASFVVAISSFGRSQLYMLSRYSDWPKVQVVHCGLEVGFYGGQANAVGRSPRLVCVGRLCEAKGQLLLVEAASRLSAQGTALEIVLVGDGPMRQEIEALIHRHGLSQQISITGWVSSARVRDEILASRALVLPSFAEGLPVVIMEAMALRRPVLTTYVAGIPELVRHAKTGWLFPPGSVEALAEAMHDCLASTPEELQAMGETAHATVLTRHSIDTEAAKLANLFKTSTSAGQELRGVGRQLQHLVAERDGDDLT